MAGLERQEGHTATTLEEDALGARALVRRSALQVFPPPARRGGGGARSAFASGRLCRVRFEPPTGV